MSQVIDLSSNYKSKHLDKNYDNMELLSGTPEAIDSKLQYNNKFVKEIDARTVSLESTFYDEYGILENKIPYSTNCNDGKGFIDENSYIVKKRSLEYSESQVRSIPHTPPQKKRSVALSGGNENLSLNIECTSAARTVIGTNSLYSPSIASSLRPDNNTGGIHSPVSFRGGEINENSEKNYSLLHAETVNKLNSLNSNLKNNLLGSITSNPLLSVVLQVIQNASRLSRQKSNGINNAANVSNAVNNISAAAGISNVSNNVNHSNIKLVNNNGNSNSDLENLNLQYEGNKTNNSPVKRGNLPVFATAALALAYSISAAVNAQSKKNNLASTSKTSISDKQDLLVESKAIDTSLKLPCSEIGIWSKIHSQGINNETTPYEFKREIYCGKKQDKPLCYKNYNSILGEIYYCECNPEVCIWDLADYNEIYNEEFDYSDNDFKNFEKSFLQLSEMNKNDFFEFECKKIQKDDINNNDIKKCYNSSKNDYEQFSPTQFLIALMNR